MNCQRRRGLLVTLVSEGNVNTTPQKYDASSKNDDRHLQHEFGFGVEVCLHVEVVLKGARDVEGRLALGYGALDARAGALSTQRTD